MSISQVGAIYNLNLDNTPADYWMTLAHKERAYINCHQQDAKLIRGIPATQTLLVLMLSGPSKDKEILIDQSWLSVKKDKILCNCPELVVFNRGCQDTASHE